MNGKWQVTALLFVLAATLGFGGLLVLDSTGILEIRSASNAGNTQAASVQQQTAQQSAPRSQPPEEPTDIEIANYIDDMAGHPDDPMLPDDVIGASDIVLSDTNSREIASLLDIGVDFARRNAQQPRFLFALGRAAYVHGYNKLGKEMLEEAATRGSGAAYAYLGYVALDESETDFAIRQLNLAVQNKFDSDDVRATLRELSEGNDEEAQTHDDDEDDTSPMPEVKLSDFNRPNLIQAAYRGDVAGMERIGVLAVIYLGSIHETLWSDNILFISESPQILMEMDADTGVKLGLKMVTSEAMMGQALQQTGGSILDGFMAMARTRQEGGSVLQEFTSSTKKFAQATIPYEIAKLEGQQDGRRLAMLYDADPDTFRRIYAGIKAFAK